MKNVFLISAGVLVMAVAHGQTVPAEYNNFIKKGENYLKEKNDNAPYAYSAAFKTIGWRVIPTGNYTNDCYNAARAWTMVRKPDSAFFYLDRIVNKLSFTDFARLSNDSSFFLLRYDKRWEPLVESVIPKNTFEKPTGWYMTGGKPYNYQMGIDRGSGQDGKNAATIKSMGKNINGFGTLMQDISPDKFLGKRIRMTGELKVKDVAGWAGLWLRVDGEPKQTLSFDNMQDRAIKGTTDWKKYEIVLDVPVTATNIAFGALLDETGQIWFDNLKFEIVDKSVPTTGAKKGTEPINLDFEK